MKGRACIFAHMSSGNYGIKARISAAILAGPQTQYILIRSLVIQLTVISLIRDGRI